MNLSEELLELPSRSVTGAVRLLDYQPCTEKIKSQKTLEK